jgi:hypothetical protein
MQQARATALQEEAAKLASVRAELRKREAELAAQAAEQAEAAAEVQIAVWSAHCLRTAHNIRLSQPAHPFSHASLLRSSLQHATVQRRRPKQEGAKMLQSPIVVDKITALLSTSCPQVRVRGDAAAAAKRELEAGRAALARGRDELLQSQRALAQAQVSL